MSKQKLGIGKKGGAALLSAALAVMMFPAAAIPAFAAEDEVVCDISKGSVTIQNDRLSYTDSSGNAQSTSISSKTPIVVTGSTTENNILVQDYDDAPINMIFRDLTIDFSESMDSKCAAYFGGESMTWLQGRVNLTLEGANTIVSTDYAGIAVPQGETLTIDGTGSLDASSVKANAGTTGPGIGSPISDNNAPAAIMDETIDTSFGTIIFNGGTINATSYNAGIGGSQHSSSGDIVINGGNITATAGEGSSAGIGCGQDAKIGSIIITGGTINATGSNSGPGVGSGGMHTDSGIIFIMGGDITATGGNYAPGIGGSGTNGYGHGDAQLINISGGTVKAYGGNYAAGIGGGGPYGLADDIVISGGDISAYGGGGTASESVHTSGGGRGQQGTEDGTQLSIYAPGAGIGNGGAQASIIDYTSGDNAGTTSASQTARFGGKVSISGGTIRAYSGYMDSEDAALVTAAGYNLVTEAIGDGGYVKELATEEDLAEACVKTITGGTIYEDGALTAANLSSAAISGLSNKAYTGKAITQSPVVKVDGTTLKAGTDYTVSYKNNTNVGTATVTVTGAGGFVGSKSATFKITAPSVAASKVKKIKVGKKQMTVTAKKVSGATGYQIAYRIKGKGKFKTKTAKANGKLKIKKLKSGKKYEVKVTTVKKVGSKTFTAKASKAKVSKAIK